MHAHTHTCFAITTCIHRYIIIKMEKKKKKKKDIIDIEIHVPDVHKLIYKKRKKKIIFFFIDSVWNIKIYQ